MAGKGSERADKRGTTNGADKGSSSFNDGDDFIPFARDDDDTGKDEPPREASPPVREWDKGKGKGKGKERARENASAGAGKKRKAEEIDLNDGYANKKERIAAASRKAPWASSVDWDSCANVAELYVAFLAGTGL